MSRVFSLERFRIPPQIDPETPFKVVFKQNLYKPLHEQLTAGEKIELSDLIDDFIHTTIQARRSGKLLQLKNGVEKKIGYVPESRIRYNLVALDKIINGRNSTDLYYNLATSDYEVFNSFLSHQLFSRILELVTYFKIHNPFLLALLATKTNFSNENMTDSRQQILPWGVYAKLCSDAEDRLLRSIRENAVILVNDSLLLKFYGKMAALCLKSYTTANGQRFIAENWYSPVDEADRENLVSAFILGKGRVSCDTGKWALRRQFNRYLDPAVMVEIQNHAQQLGPYLGSVSQTIDRRDYQYANQEFE
jgi:hypothetical protein